MEDIILRGTIGDADARFFMAVTTDLVEETRRIHDLSPTATAALGRLLTASSVMALMLKDGGHSVTVTIKGGGPAGSLVAVAHPDGTVKGYVSNPQADLPVRSDGKLDVGGLVGRDGLLTVVRDMGAGEPYVGQCALQSGEIAEDFAWYFTTSEQQPSLVALGVLVGGGQGVLSAGGLIIQPLPGCSEDILDVLETRAPVIGDLSRHLYEFGDGETLLSGLLSGIPWEIHHRIRPVFSCDCSRDRVERALMALDAEAMGEMIAQEEPTEVSCHFCGSKYAISPTRLAELRSISQGERTEKGDERAQQEN